jgi:FkbH-like protein
MNQARELRGQIDQLLTEQRWPQAHGRLRDLWRQDKSLATANYVASCYERLKVHVALKDCKVSILRSMTLEPLLPILRAAGYVAGIDLTVQLGQFNAYAQELLDGKSWVYRFQPDVVILAVQTRDLMPGLWDRTWLTESEAKQLEERAAETFAVTVSACRERSNASIVMHNLEKPVATGVLDAQALNGRRTAIEQFNARLRELCARHRGVYVLDYDELVARHGRLKWHDESKWQTMRMPFNSDSFAPMVNEWMKFLHPLTGSVCKALVVDFDDTLWGGVLGEVGPEGIEVGPDYPGAAHRALQRVILDLHNRGVLLAASSKNDHAEAVVALQNHPGMLLRPEHFAAMRINWNDKSQSLEEIARELNIGLDAVAFLDNSPVERESVRRALPEVTVIELPARADGFASALSECPVFERLSLSEEDRNHTRLYHQQKQRSELAGRVRTVEDFYRSLEQEVSIAPVRPETLTRVAQLTQKTNQYNATTRRYTEQQIEDFASRADWSVYSVQVRDRFGDNGIVGVIVSRAEEQSWEIDTFLLSCRVIGRTVETAMLAFLAEAGKADGAKVLRGLIVPTNKNGPIRELYRSHSFRPIHSDGNIQKWLLDLEEHTVSCPDWIRLHATDRVSRAEQATA